MNDNMDLLKEYLKDEDTRNPYKDEQLAAMMQTTRYEIIRMRKKLGVATYSERRLPQLQKSICDIQKEEPGISITKLTGKLREEGYHVSRFLISQICDEIVSAESANAPDTKKASEQAKHDKETDAEGENTEILVGKKGSIKTAIENMRAAFLYPENGLNTIIAGETGTGKSRIVEAVYDELVNEGKIHPDRKLIKYNCATYANNPELLASQLFGHAKGAFTGADADKAGLIEAAGDGILFLDEIHRLSDRGQEMLFSIIDDGVYYRLGQPDQAYSANLMIIGATTEKLDSVLLDTFRRRIPMHIQLPSLSERSTEERLALIEYILRKEAELINRELVIDSTCLASLMTYRCAGNIGQLSSDIKVAVARAFVEGGSNDAYITISARHMNQHILSDVGRKFYSKELSFYRDHGIMIMPGKKDAAFYDEKWIEVPADRICEMITRHYGSLTQQELPQVLIANMLSRELEYRVKTAAKFSIYEKGEADALDYTDSIKNIALEIINEIVDRTQSFKPDIGRCFRVTLMDLIAKAENSWEFPPIHLKDIEQKYMSEHIVAYDCINKVCGRYNRKLPTIAADIAAVYMHIGCNVWEHENNNVKIMIVTHGNIASAIANTCNYFMKSNIVGAVDIPLDMDEQDYEAFIVNSMSDVREDELLFLTDMGATLTFGEIVAARTNKKTKSVGRVDLYMALAAANCYNRGHTSLEEIYDYVKDKSAVSGKRSAVPVKPTSRCVIVSCMTGQGAADNIATFIQEQYSAFMDNVELITLGVMTPEIREYIRHIHETRRIIACIGSYHIDLEDVPFIKISDMLQEKGRNDLKWLLSQDKENAISGMNLSDFIYRDAIFTDVDIASKEEAIIFMTKQLCTEGYVKESYMQAVLDREREIPTDYRYGTAIPHAGSEHVNKSVISIMRLKKSIFWNSDVKAQLIFLIALEKSDVKLVTLLSHLIKDEACMRSLRKGTAHEMIEAINGFDQKRSVQYNQNSQKKNISF